MAGGQRGHRTVPHTADVRIEAWAGDREACIAEAVRALVGTCLDVTSAQPASTWECHVDEGSDEDLLVFVLEEVIYRMEVAQEVPVSVDIVGGDRGTDVRFVMARSSGLPQVGAVPKAVSWHDLHCAPAGVGWSCGVTVDV